MPRETKSDESIFFRLFQKAFKMKKIIILSDTYINRIDMVSSLKELFPECEIQILIYQLKSIDEGMTIETMSFNPSEVEKTIT